MSAVPTRKVGAGILGGAATVILVWAIGLAGVEVPAEVASSVTTVISFGLSYFVKEPREV